jgi:hypothetical protein
MTDLDAPESEVTRLAAEFRALKVAVSAPNPSIRTLETLMRIRSRAAKSFLVSSLRPANWGDLSLHSAMKPSRSFR